MFFIFGWGHKKKTEFGRTLPVHCPNCNNDAFYLLYQIKHYFTLFFVPVLPVENKHYLICEICTKGFELNEEQLRMARQMNEATKALGTNSITPESYKALLLESPILQIEMNKHSHASLSKVCPTCNKGYDESWNSCLSCNVALRPKK